MCTCFLIVDTSELNYGLELIWEGHGDKQFLTNLATNMKIHQNTESVLLF